MESSNKVKFIIIGVSILFVLITIRLIYLQLIDKSYQISAQNNALKYEVKYPIRGLIKDRNGKILVANKNAYNIWVTPYNVKNLDTNLLCSLFSIDTNYVREKFLYYKKYRTKIGYQSKLFLQHISTEQYNHFIEIKHKFPGFEAKSSFIRDYPFNAGANLIGYITEVSPKVINENKHYRAGDYIGRTGLEEICENQLRGEKGFKIFLRDAKNVILSPYENGKYDKAAKAGKNIISSIDAELQQYGEQLMNNKVGSLVAIEPQTGEILAMISSPGISTDKLATINKYYSEIANDPYNPMFNRAIMSPQPPGSTFKLVNALIGLEEGVITASTKIACHEGYVTRGLTVGCHSHKSPVNLHESIMMSCNAYYCSEFRSILDNPKYNSVSEAMDVWRKYVTSFGLGSSLKSDFPSEKGGYIPTPKLYDKIYGKNSWNSLSVVSLSIGQGEIGCTPLQLANLSATIANRGYYITPHIIKSYENTKESSIKLKKHKTLISKENFELVIEGMSRAVNAPYGTGGTATIARIPGVEVCGKTGTSENPHGDTHSIFICFAPRENPKIAVAVYVENAGYGATWAAPIASLLTEKYINDTISKPRLWLEEKMFNSNLLDKVPAWNKLSNEEKSKLKNRKDAQ